MREIECSIISISILFLLSAILRPSIYLLLFWKFLQGLDIT